MIPPDEPPESLWKKEDIQMKLDKIPEIEAKLQRFENEIILINKRITGLQDNKEDRKGSSTSS